MHVLTAGCFDVLHVGHVRFLKGAKALGDKLTVLISCDAEVERQKGPKRPVFSHYDRMEILYALYCVDLVILNEDVTAEKWIERLKPDIFAKGLEYRGRCTDQLKRERIAVEAVGGKLVLVGEDVVHSTDILKRLG
jgi:rfaE bifunctional protein nucleotidyltransferase chain/domain